MNEGIYDHLFYARINDVFSALKNSQLAGVLPDELLCDISSMVDQCEERIKERILVGPEYERVDVPELQTILFNHAAKHLDVDQLMNGLPDDMWIVFATGGQWIRMIEKKAPSYYLEQLMQLNEQMWYTGVYKPTYERIYNDSLCFGKEGCKGLVLELYILEEFKIRAMYHFTKHASKMQKERLDINKPVPIELRCAIVHRIAPH